MDESSSVPEGGQRRGGQGDRLSSGLTVSEEAVLDKVAIAKGWLKDKRGIGLDHERLANLIARNYQRGMITQDDRALGSLTRNVIAAVSQVMEQEKRDAGGEHHYVHIDGTVSNPEFEQLAYEELLRCHREAVESLPTDRNGQPPASLGS